MTLMQSAPSWVKHVAAASLVALAFAINIYFSGVLFLLSQKMSPDQATFATLYQYWYYYGSDKNIENWIFISLVASLLITVVAPVVIFFKPVRQSLYGDAKFATKKEIVEAGLLGDKGIICGKYDDQYLMFKGMQHVMLSAPTRSGKGVGIVIPNLLNWPESVVVLDIKQENWDITSGFRAKHGHKCYLFNPAATDYRTHRYNPLSYISEDPLFRVDDIQKIANMVYPDVEGTDPIWTASPRQLFVGVVLMLIETPEKPVTFGQVLRESLVDGDGSKYFAKIIKDRASTGKPLSAACMQALNGYISISAENTRSGIMATFRSRLELWSNPLVDAATSENDFDLRDVRKKKMSIYLGVTPDNLDRMAPILNLFFQQLVDINTRELPHQNEAIKYTCLLLMDEFTAIGKMAIISKGISYIAGYLLRCLVIFQSPAQLDAVYGKDEAANFRTNHALQIIYPPKATETATAKDISEWLGYQTVKGYSHSKAKGIFGKKTPTESTSDQRRALMLPQEITGMTKGTELVVVEDVAPILAKKITYFDDVTFVNRLKSVSKTLNQLGNKIPSKHTLEAVIKDGELATKVPVLNIEAHYKAFSRFEPMVGITDESSVDVVVKEEKFSIKDVLNIDKFALKDFAINFSGIKQPKTSANVNVGEMDSYIASLCAAAGI